MSDQHGLTILTGDRGPARFRRAADIARRAEAAGFRAVGERRIPMSS